MPSSFDFLTLFSSETIMNCVYNCSGRGDCNEGVCYCQVQFAGGNCGERNMPYYVGFGSGFYVIFLVSLVQLCLCIHSEYTKMSKQSLFAACRITVQKSLYLLTMIATALRAVYFTVGTHLDDHWSPRLASAYYPVVLTGLSLIVCFWAEKFHMPGSPNGHRSFLTKSFIGFLMFNVTLYIVYCAEVIVMQWIEGDDKSKQMWEQIFRSVYAALMVICCGFLLYYGVEVFFKVRGAFAPPVIVETVDKSVKTVDEDVPDEDQKSSQHPTLARSNSRAADLNAPQAYMSRFGLVSLASFYLFTAAFLLVDVSGLIERDGVSVLQKNIYSVTFRLIELAIVLWIPCVLWNWSSPDQLWILNPRRLIKAPSSIDMESSSSSDSLISEKTTQTPRSDDEGDSVPQMEMADCWICYDNTRTDAGDLVNPCACRGDVSTVHQECLRKWLRRPTARDSGNDDAARQEMLKKSRRELDEFRCKVCHESYALREGKARWATAVDVRFIAQTSALCFVVVACPLGVYAVFTYVVEQYIHYISLGAMLFIEFIAVKALGVSVGAAYRRAKVAALIILDRMNDRRKRNELKKWQRREQIVGQQQQKYDKVIELQTSSHM